MRTYTFPKQRIKESEKDEKWSKECIDFIIDKAISLNDKSEQIALYKSVNGDLSKEDYNYVLNPYNSSEDKFSKYPGNLRNFDIITPIIERYLGEYIKQSQNFQVVCVNPDVTNRKKEELNKTLKQVLSQQYMNVLNELGMDTGVESKEVPNANDVKNEHDKNYNDTRSIIGQQAVNVLTNELEYESNYVEGWFHFIVSNCVVTYRDIVKDNIYKEVIHPLEYYRVSNGNRFIEDDDMGVRVFRLTIPQIIDIFTNRLKEKDLTYLEDILLNCKDEYGYKIDPEILRIRNGGNIEAINEYANLSGSSAYWFGNNDMTIDVYHVVYKTQRMVKVLKYYDFVLNKELEMEVNEHYKLNKENGDISISIEWRNQVYEGYRFGKDIDNIYIHAKPLLVQRNDLNNESICKLPYNGITGIVNFDGIPSIVKRLLPYQVLHNIMHLLRERAVAKYKGEILILPKELLGSDDIDQEEAIYRMAADGVLYVSTDITNFQSAINGAKSVTVGDFNYIKAITELIAMNKQDAWELVNMNDQRFGNIATSAGKGTTQEAVFRVIIGSVPMFNAYNKFLERDMLADLDYSKMAWINGKKGSYINSDEKVAFFEVNPLEYTESSYQIYIKNNAIEEEKRQKLLDIAFAAAQNGNFELAIEAIEQKSTREIADTLKKLRNLEILRGQEEAEKDRQVQLQIEQSRKESENMLIQTNLQIAQIKEDGANQRKMVDIDIALIKEGNSDDYDSVEEQINIIGDRQTKLEELNIKKQKLQSDIDNNNKKLDIEKMKLKSNEKIAQMNKNKYDK